MPGKEEQAQVYVFVVAQANGAFLGKPLVDAVLLMHHGLIACQCHQGATGLQCLQDLQPLRLEWLHLQTACILTTVSSQHSALTQTQRLRRILGTQTLLARLVKRSANLCGIAQ